MPKRFSRRVVIVCDALDEMDETQQRQRIFPLFHEMKDNGFSFFLTSRPHPADVRESFCDAIQIDIIPDPKDLALHVRNTLDRSVKFLKVIRGSHRVNLESIVSTLVSSAEGM